MLASDKSQNQSMEDKKKNQAFFERYIFLVSRMGPIETVVSQTE